MTQYFLTGPIDTQPPTITATLIPAVNSQGWHLEPVTVFFTCADAEYLVQSCPHLVTISTEGAQVESASITKRHIQRGERM